MLETLAAEDDEDAALILRFELEDSTRDVIQNDNEMCAFYPAYQDARKRLSEKVRFRAFWSGRQGEKGGGKEGKVKGKGKGTLASRIANSSCRLCLKKGYWKNECPNRNASASNAPSASSTSVPTTFAVTDEIPEVLINMAITDVTWMMRDKYRGRTGGNGDNQSKGHKWGKQYPLPSRRHMKDRPRKILVSERMQSHLSSVPC